MKSRIQLAKKEIQIYFDSQTVKIYKLSDLRKVFNQNCEVWRLMRSETVSNFVKELCKTTPLKKIELNFPNRKETRYVWGDASVYNVLMDINPRCYFSHYTAMFFNNLTQQIPKTIFLNTEQTPKNLGFVSAMEQNNIDLAFRNKARETNNITKYGPNKIYHLSGKFTNNLGVTETEVGETGNVRITNIERTLIDIVVRPMYSGGIFEVVKAYQLAKGRVSVNKLLSYLQQLNFKYPYHQAIGFLLEKASYSESQLGLVRELDKPFDFYLDYGMADMKYNSTWKLYHPSGL